jgi:Asp-tRNA(Asn)/Glu-tRNA(Gln) amidotransferase A subunit family amidase
LKPTYGRISVEGVTPLSLAFDHVELLAGNIDVLEKGWLALRGGVNLAGPVTEIRRIGFDPARLSMADAAIRAAIEQMLALLVRQGYALVEVALPDQAALGEIHGAIVCGEALEIWRDHWPIHGGGFTKTAARALSYAALIEPSEIVKARQVLVDVRRYMAEQIAEVDAILGPTIAVEPPVEGARLVSMGGIDVPVVNALLVETCPFNVSGHPALSVPLAAHTGCGTPVALQIAVAADRERSALALARVITNIEAQA